MWLLAWFGGLYLKSGVGSVGIASYPSDLLCYVAMVWGEKDCSLPDHLPFYLFSLVTDFGFSYLYALLQGCPFSS